MSFLGKTGNFIHRITGDAGLRLAVNLWLRKEGYGKMIELRLDHAARTVELSVLLKGEERPINVWIDNYRIHRDGEWAAIEVTQARADRPWVEAALKNFVVGRLHEIPADKAELLNDFLA